MIKGGKLYLGKGRIVSLTSIGIVYALLASFSYGYSFSSFMFASIIVSVYTYGILIVNSKRIPGIYLIALLGIVGISVINGLVRGNILDPISVSTSLILPLTIATLDFIDADNYRMYIPCCVITFIIVYVQLKTSFLENYNVNTLGFILYMGSSFGIIWLKLSSKKLYPTIYLFLAFLLMLKTDCRNAIIVMILMSILIFLPDKLYKIRWFFRTIYIVVLSYTILAFTILEFAFSNSFISKVLTYISLNFSTKTYGMFLRIQYFISIKDHLNRLSLVSKLIGRGVNDGSGHNMFYQGMFVYGILGTFIIYTFYIKIFEMSYTLFKRNNDYVALGCFIGLMGNLLLQGADEYLICNPTCVVMPFIMVGLVMSRYRVYKKRI